MVELDLHLLTRIGTQTAVLYKRNIAAYLKEAGGERTKKDISRVVRNEFTRSYPDSDGGDTAIAGLLLLDMIDEREVEMSEKDGKIVYSPTSASPRSRDSESVAREIQEKTLTQLSKIYGDAFLEHLRTRQDTPLSHFCQNQFLIEDKMKPIVDSVVDRGLVVATVKGDETLYRLARQPAPQAAAAES